MARPSQKLKIGESGPPSGQTYVAVGLDDGVTGSHQQRLDLNILKTRTDETRSEQRSQTWSDSEGPDGPIVNRNKDGQHFLSLHKHEANLVTSFGAGVSAVTFGPASRG